MQVTCFQCNIGFRKPKCHIERVTKVFCSRNCRDKEQTQFTSKTCVICGELFKIRGNMKKYSSCPKEKCRQANKSRENNPNWQGGITKPRNAAMSSLKYKYWRMDVFMRDDYTCQFCGKRGGELNADHIESWASAPHLRYTLSNGRTLCLPCHKTTYKENYQQMKKAKNG